MTGVFERRSSLEAMMRSAVIAAALLLGWSTEQKDVAQDAYSRIIKDSPDSPFRADAEAALKRMGLPIPAPAPAKTEVK